MEYAIEVLENNLINCRNAKNLDDKYPEGKSCINWEARIKQLETAIQKLKVDDTETKRYIEKLENACCDCSDFEEFGFHGENCYVKKLRGEK